MAAHELVLDETWAYGAGIQHGGYLLQTLASQARSERHPHPLAVTSHFLAAPRLGPARVEVEPLRSGRSTSTARSRLLQGDRVCVDAVVTSGLLPARGTPAAYAGLAAPDLPALADCHRTGPGLGLERNGITEQLDIRLDPAGAGWEGGTGHSGQVQGYLRAADGSAPDPLSLLCLADALPPVTFALGLPGWAPTVELTVYVRALPAPGWVRAVQRAGLVQDGWLDESCELWDAEGHLVAQAVQLAAYRPA